MPTNIAAICPSPLDATSLYRGLGPLGQLKRSGEFQISVLGQYDWSMMKLIDALFLQRPFMHTHVVTMQLAKASCKPIWVDYDDDLFHVPVDNPSYVTYGREKVQRDIAVCIAMADIVTVATERLVELLKPVAKDIRLVPNAHDDELFGTERAPHSNNKLILWRGSASHERDVWHHGEALVTTAKERPDWKFCFAGYNPWFVTEAMAHEQALIIPMMDPLEYFSFIKKVGPRIVVVPLVPNEFNLAKSNIAWMEATYAGAVCVAPDIPEWRRPGIVNYRTTNELKTALMRLTDSEVTLEHHVKDSWDYITSNLLLSNVNQSRVQVMRDLVDMAKSAEWRKEARSGIISREEDAKAQAS